MSTASWAGWSSRSHSANGDASETPNGIGDIGQPFIVVPARSLTSLVSERRDHQCLDCVQSVLRLVEDDGSARLEHLFGDFQGRQAPLLEDLEADRGLGVVQGGKAVHEFHLWVAGRCHDLAVDLVGEQLVYASVPLVGRFPHREPNVGVQEIGPVDRSHGVLGDHDPSTRLRRKAIGYCLDLRSRPQCLGSGDTDVHA